MHRKINIFIFSLLVWFFIGSLIYLVPVGFKIFNSSPLTFLVFIAIFFTLKKPLSRWLLKVNIDKYPRIKIIFNIFYKLFIVGAVLILIYLLIVYPFILRPIQVNFSYGNFKGKNGTLFAFVYHSGLTRINRSDIISYFSQLNSGETITRVIGIPGDKVRMKGGFVYLNGKLLKEPYTILPRKTWTDYSGVILGKNCEEITVPQHKFFVLGDDREVGFNSLVEGFIQEDKIIDYLPVNLLKSSIFNPNKFFNNNRDVSKDADLIKESILNNQDYVSLINLKRHESGIEPLKYEKRLEQSANLRLQKMIDLNDFSYEATKSGYVAWKAISDVGYKDKVYSYLERTLMANFNSSSLFDFYWNSQDKQNLLDKDLRYIGIASKIIDIDSCPKQVIVQHFLSQ